MLGFSLRRLVSSALLLLLVLTGTFFLIHVAPGEPARLFDNPFISPEKRQELRQLYGLDKPLQAQYVHWLGSVLTGRWGTSITFGRPAWDVLLERLPNTALLVAAVLVIEHVVGLALGIFAAARAGTFVDRQIRLFSLAIYSLPLFWLALLMIEFLTVRWTLFPTNQMRSEGAETLPLLAQTLDVLHHLALPALALGLVRSGGVVRYVRNGLLEVLGQDYIRTARAKGLRPARVLWVHALRNSIIPLVQRFGVSLPLLLSGSLIIEVVFSWPGIGLAIHQAIQQRDYPVVLASTALSGAMVITGSLVADLLHAWLDPRVRHG